MDQTSAIAVLQMSKCWINGGIKLLAYVVFFCNIMRKLNDSLS